MQTPPPLPQPRRPPRRHSGWLLWLLGGLFAILFVAGVAYAVIFGLFILPYEPFMQHRAAPDGWTTPKPSRLPPESAFLGRWTPAGPAVTLPFADGTPHTLQPQDDLTLNPDHTYRFLHRGIYNADSQLICLRSETGQWQLTPPAQDYPEISLVADLPSIVIEHRVIPDLNMDNVNFNSMAEQQKHPDAPRPDSQPGDDKRIVDEDNAMACSSSAPRDGFAVDWRIAIAHGNRLALFRDAPGMIYSPPNFPAKGKLAAQVLYEHVTP